MSAFLPDSNLPSSPSGAHAAAADGQRRQYRPPIGIPIQKQRGLVGAIIAVLLHVLLVLVFILPYFGIDVIGEMTGAGGPGPAGGGGGGRGGTGGGRVANERITYVVPAPPPPTVESKFIQPPVVQPPPEVKPPEVKPPVETPPPVAPVTEPATAASTTGPVSDVASATAGSGGGAGNDGSGGSGPGSGGGVGSGIGTGRGSGVGAGTGGGTGTIFPPTPSELFIPPVPVPDRVKGRTITIVFDVDSTGKVIDFELTPTRDAAYNRKLREILGATRFRPATDGTGRPVRAKYNLDYTF
jgi:periplasmic protein TonB